MTEMTELQKNLQRLLPCAQLRFDEPMNRHTSFRIGGPVEVMAFPKSREELSALLKTSALMDVKPVILGAGTNILAPDSGLSGLVICLKDCMDGMERLDDTRIRVMAGVTMTRAAMFAAGLGLSGMEFAHGIPGSVGGGVYMNAGAYGGEIGGICESVEIMDMAGNISIRDNAGMEFSYRHSCLEEEEGIVISAVFRLEPKPVEEIREKMKLLQEKRSASQPLNFPSAGSAFKRPVGGFAAALIDQAGLKGFRVGGAGISEKHAGFAVNLGGATASDVRELLRQVSDRVYENSGIRLEPEIRIW
ncbi:MAG: UDP-N-acetylmuramate dehydrogenase [Oscillospiraceae bacterium]|nr:UDP-N-acetylmuramate dehydrogenase [Oscillospiraceae bacterium]